MSGLNRREFILASAGCAAFAQGCALGRREDVELVRFGMVSDLHYARIPCPEESDRYYDQGVVKLHECVETMNERQVDFLIELGDFKDECPTKEGTLACLDEIEAEFSRFKGPRYHVLGNHENDCLTKEAVLTGHQHWGGQVTLNGIFYYTLRALVVGAAPEHNSYAEVSFYGSGKILVRGFRQTETAVCVKRT